MNPELFSEQKEIEKSSTSLPFPNSGWARFHYALFIIAMPIFSFAGTELIKPEWQSGQLSAYVSLFLFPEASVIFLVLLAYSIVCYILLLIATAKYSQSFVIRLGVYTGVLLAIQYSFALLIVSTFPNNLLFIIPLWMTPPVASKMYQLATLKWGRYKTNIGIAILGAAAYVITSVLIWRDLRSPIVLIFMGLVLAAPFWSFLLSIRAAIWLLKNYETKIIPSRMVGVVAWIGTYVAAWRFDILKMYELYNALPKAPPPDCYIATAAAQGHSRFVGSHEVLLANGKSMFVNRQLQILKCTELALLAIFPHVHQVIRGIYDKLGRPLARRIQNPFLADVSYLLLKPCELLALIILKLILPDFEATSRKIYETI